MFNNDQVSSASWFFIGVIIVLASIPYGLGGVHSPGTGFMPFLTGLALCILSIIEFVRATRENRKGKRWKTLFKDLQWDKPLIALAGLLVYALLWNSLGYLIGTALLVGFLLRVIYPQKWLVVILGAILSSSLSYIIFQIWLEAQLPRGILDF